VTFGIFYTILLVGSVTMIFPFLLMLGTSITGATDILEYKFVPEYLYRTDPLFVRYTWNKYQDLATLQPRYGLYGLTRLVLKDARICLAGLDGPRLAGALGRVRALRQAAADHQAAREKVKAAGGEAKAPKALLADLWRQDAALAAAYNAADGLVLYLHRELADVPEADLAAALDRLGDAPPADLDAAVARAAPLGNWKARQFRRLLDGCVLVGLKRDDARRARQVRDMLAWMTELPGHLKYVAFNPAALTTTGRINRLYRDFLRGRYPDVEAVNAAYGTRYESFLDPRVPFERPEARDWVPTPDRRYRDFLDFKATVGPEYFIAAEGTALWQRHLRSTFDARVEALNAALGADYRKFEAIALPLSLPADKRLAEHWNGFVRRKWPIRLMRFAPAAETAYRAFVKRKFTAKAAAIAKTAGTAPKPLARLQADYGVDLGDWADLKFPAPAEMLGPRLAHLEEFVRGKLVKASEAPTAAVKAVVSGKPHADLSAAKGLLDVKDVRLFDAAEHYRRWAAARVAPDAADEAAAVAAINAAYGTRFATLADVRPAYAEMDYHVVGRDRTALRWQYVVENFREVIEFIAIKGRALWFTALFVGLTILTHLTVNPLAAYALSRYNLSYSNKVLLFCLATMAFPAEVEMIPRFLLLRGFPVWPLIGGVAVAAILLALLLVKFKMKPLLGVFISLSAGAVTGVFLVPLLLRTLGVAETKPLLNSLWALVLPGMAGGFTIFILKGFFDTLPKELYEAAQLDGASELRMFFQITVPLCKPVFAYIALISFVGSYSAFIFALTVCQDPKSWTIMVWLYDLQTTAPDYVKVAAMCVAMVPTLIVFVTCQRVIMRGIILPQMH